MSWSSTFRKVVRWILAMAAFCVIGCRYNVRSIRSSDEVVGEYAYQHKGGQVEVLTLRKNNTFRQDLFNNAATYKSYGKPQFSIDGAWNYGGSLIEFKPFLNFTWELDPKQFRETPSESYNGQGIWLAPTKDVPAVIDISGEFKYPLVRITDRRTFRW